MASVRKPFLKEKKETKEKQEGKEKTEDIEQREVIMIDEAEKEEKKTPQRRAMNFEDEGNATDNRPS